MREASASGSGPRVFSNPLWPLAVPFVGLPLWWILGLWQIMFFFMAAVMFVYLVKQKTIEMPRGFWIWLLWMAWLFTGLLVMQVTAPGTISGTNTNRYLVFAFRYAWYVAATIVALYVVNTRHILSTKRLLETVSWFFVVLVGGGLLGLLLPELSVDSLLQSLLPRGLANHSLVNELTHIQSAQIHSVLGSPQPRPSAPFIYTNGWGFATAVTIPLFIVAWWRRGGSWRVWMAVVLVLALIPIVLSLNRGTWIAIFACFILAVVHSAAHGRIEALTLGAAGALLAVCLVLFSPLGGMVQARFLAGHSDEGRENLSAMAIQSTIEGSPIVGFGTTRNITGNFSSIAGGASEVCPNCEPPPVGTHGQMWLAVFGAGFVGAALFVGFLLVQFLMNLRLRSPYALAALSSVLVLLVTLPIYNAIGPSLFVGFIAIGILGRESSRVLPALQETIRPAVRNVPIIALCIGVGAAAGFGVDSFRGVPVTATLRVLVPTADFAPVPGIRASTLDAEAMLVRSTSVVAAVAQELEISRSKVRSGLTTGAEPNTRVLLIAFQATNANDASRGVEAAVDAFLVERDRFLTANATILAQRYTTRQVELEEIYGQTRSVAQLAKSQYLWSTVSALSRELASASETLSNAEIPPHAQVISSPAIATLNDVRTVRAASGIGLGALGGLLLVRFYDRRYIRLGKRPELNSALGLPIVARCAGSDLDAAVRAVSGYLPLAGLVADSESLAAMLFASRIDDELVTGGYTGARTLLVVEPRTRAYRVKRMIDGMGRRGLSPVGLIFHLPRPQGSRSRARTTRRRT